MIEDAKGNLYELVDGVIKKVGNINDKPKEEDKPNVVYEFTIPWPEGHPNHKDSK